MRRICVLAAMLSIGLTSYLSARAFAGELPSEISTQYGSALEKFRNVYAKATVQGTVSWEYPGDKSREQSFVLRVDGARVRIDVKTLTKHHMPDKVGSSDMYMSTPDGSLHTFEGPGSPAFDNADEESKAKAKGKIESLCLMTYPYSFDGKTSLLEMLGQSSCKILSVEKIGPKAHPLIKINYQETIRGKEAPVTHKSYLIVAPSEGWALREFYRITGQPGSETIRRGSLSYSGMQDGVPLVSRIEYREERGTPRKQVLLQVVSISQFQIGEPDDYYFTSFAF